MGFMYRVVASKYRAPRVFWPAQSSKEQAVEMADRLRAAAIEGGWTYEVECVYESTDHADCPNCGHNNCICPD